MGLDPYIENNFEFLAKNAKVQIKSIKEETSENANYILVTPDTIDYIQKIFLNQLQNVEKSRVLILTNYENSILGKNFTCLKKHSSQMKMIF